MSNGDNAVHVSSGVEALIQRLRDEGVESGRAQAEKIVADAETRAEISAQLEALIIVTDATKSFLVSGNGDLLQPDEDGLLAIGSGANYALAAARALLRHTEMSAAEITRAAMTVAAEICVFTNDRLTLEEI